jgi:hypothetical protein
MFNASKIWFHFETGGGVVGVGINLRLSPRREAADEGSDICFVRSWNAALTAFRR